MHPERAQPLTRLAKTLLVFATCALAQPPGSAVGDTTVVGGGGDIKRTAYPLAIQESVEGDTKAAGEVTQVASFDLGVAGGPRC
jgi:hypothetical protein